MPEERRAPGRPARLSKGLIAEAAVTLADTRGLESVTMRSVAEALAGTPGALYRHIAGRDALVAAMQDAVLGELDWQSAAATATTGSVRAELRAAAVALVGLHLAHPWLADIPPTPHPTGRSAQLVGSLLAILERTGAAESARWAALAVFLNLVSGLARWGGAAAGAITAEQAAGIIVDAVTGVLHPQR